MPTIVSTKSKQIEVVWHFKEEEDFEWARQN